MAIQFKDDNFRMLQSALKKGKQVKFLYRARNGELTFRVGFIAELSDSHVTILDSIADGPRKALFDGVESNIEYLRP